MSTYGLESGDHLHDLIDEELRAVAGGDNMVFCLYAGATSPTDGFYTTKQGCMQYDKYVENLFGGK